METLSAINSKKYVYQTETEPAQVVTGSPFISLQYKNRDSPETHSPFKGKCEEKLVKLRFLCRF